MKKIKELWMIYRREILIGVVVSLITTILWGVITWFVRETPKIGLSFLEFGLNTLYRSAAIHSENYASEMLLSSFVGVLIGFLFSFTKHSKSIIKKKIRSLENKDDAEEKNENNLQKAICNEKKIAEMKKSKIFLTLGSVFFTCFFVFTIAFVFVPANIYKKFTRDITMITPYVETNQVAQLKSSWVLMRGYDDYKDIYSIIDKVKEMNNLPK